MRSVRAQVLHHQATRQLRTSAAQGHGRLEGRRPSRSTRPATNNWTTQDLARSKTAATAAMSRPERGRRCTATRVAKAQLQARHLRRDVDGWPGLFDHSWEQQALLGRNRSQSKAEFGMWLAKSCGRCHPEVGRNCANHGAVRNCTQVEIGVTLAGSGQPWAGLNARLYPTACPQQNATRLAVAREVSSLWKKMSKPGETPILQT